MTGSIRQMQMAYLPEEDRILYRVNTTVDEEFRFLVTRRYAMLMLQVLREQRAADPDVSAARAVGDRQAVQAFKKEKAMTEANFESSFKADAATFPLGTEALLAYRLAYEIKPGGNLRLTIEPKAGNGINLAISNALNFTLTELILSAARKGDWGLDAWLAAGPADTNPAPVIN